MIAIVHGLGGLNTYIHMQTAAITTSNTVIFNIRILNGASILTQNTSATNTASLRQILASLANIINLKLTKVSLL